MGYEALAWIAATRFRKNTVAEGLRIVAANQRVRQALKIQAAHF